MKMQRIIAIIVIGLSLFSKTSNCQTSIKGQESGQVYRRKFWSYMRGLNNHFRIILIVPSNSILMIDDDNRFSRSSCL